MSIRVSKEVRYRIDAFDMPKTMAFVQKAKYDVEHSGRTAPLTHSEAEEIYNELTARQREIGRMLGKVETPYAASGGRPTTKSIKIDQKLLDRIIEHAKYHDGFTIKDIAELAQVEYAMASRHVALLKEGHKIFCINPSAPYDQPRRYSYANPRIDVLDDRSGILKVDDKRRKELLQASRDSR